MRDSNSQIGNPSTLFQSFASPWDSNFERENPLENVEIHSFHYPTFLETYLNIKTLKPKNEVTTWIMGYMETSLN
jgi:hypothetical protein